MSNIKRVILLKYGELILKGLNRHKFEDLLIKNIKEHISDFEVEIQRMQAVVYLFPKFEDQIDLIVAKVSQIFGISQVDNAYIVDKDISAISEIAIKLAAEYVNVKTFKIETNRPDKSFELTSYEISSEVGRQVLQNVPTLKVDVHNPDLIINIEIHKLGAVVYVEKFVGAGGLPLNSSGKGMLLMSGGIDSPVACYLMARRGVQLEVLYFHSHPYTSDRAKNKVIKLVEILSQVIRPIVLHICHFTEIQLAIKTYCPHDHLTIIMRRQMMRIANVLAQRNGCKCIVTGESLGQVASQTLESISVTDNVSEMPIFRPLIAMDKSEIIKISKKIDTYETSILPYEDCCTIFTPKHPLTKPELKYIEIKERKIPDLNKMIEISLEHIERITF